MTNGKIVVVAEIRQTGNEEIADVSIHKMETMDDFVYETLESTNNIM